MTQSYRHPPVHLGRLGFFSAMHLFCFFIFVSMASAIVHLSLYEKMLGFSGKRIGLIAALFVLATVFMPPFWGYIMDRVSDPRRVLRITVIGSTFFLLPCIFLKSYWIYFAFRFLSACFQAGLIPINDSQLLAYGSKYNLKYGPMRVWGTYGFIIAQIILAFQFLFLEDIRWMFVNWFISNMFLVITTFRMEALPSGLKRGELFKGLKLLLEPSFGIFCAGCVMQRIAMTGYYTFFSLYIVGLGLPFRVAALAWCIGPISEILVIQYGDRLVNYIGVKGLLCWALAAATARLLILSAAPPTSIIFASQLLHALTFGAMHIAGIMYVNHRVPPTLRASGQTAFTAVAYGLSGAVGNLAAGFLYDAYGAEYMLLCLAMVAFAGWIIVAVFLKPVKVAAA